jgi:hypothetical protein
VPGSLSPGLAEMIVLAGSQVPFAKAAMLTASLAGIQLTVKRVERAAERRHCAAGPRSCCRRRPRSRTCYIEAGGMRWTVDGADSIIMLRCQHASR